MRFWPWKGRRHDDGLPRGPLSMGELRQAWKRVKSGSGVCGVDGKRLRNTSRDPDRLLTDLMADLERGTYSPLPFKTSTIPKKDGGSRNLRIPAVRDRVVQQALARRLMNRFEPKFGSTSWAYRPSRGRAGAVRCLLRVCRERSWEWIARIDIRHFFDSIDHDRLFGFLSSSGVPEPEIQLIRLTLGAGVLEGKRVHRSRRGCPQGSPLSPVLSNIFLDEFDRWTADRYPGACRYADDIAIPCSSERSAKRAINAVRRQLSTQFGLQIHPEKSGVIPLHRLRFLGYSFDLLETLETSPRSLWTLLRRFTIRWTGRGSRERTPGRREHRGR